jgi:hypothetical protein
MALSRLVGGEHAVFPLAVKTVVKRRSWLVAGTQRVLSERQIGHFYHDEFVTDQVDSFMRLAVPGLVGDGTVVDMGGGCGFFAAAIATRGGIPVRVVDSDARSIETCRGSGLDADLGDALAPRIRGDERVVCFNLILHHLVGRSDVEVFELQSRALRAWCSGGRYVFVNEYIYESYLAAEFSGWLIWAITSSSLLSALAKLVSFVVPSLRANTFGVGVRFRTSMQWRLLFGRAGFREVGYLRGQDEPVSVARRLLMIKSCRRDSFLLQAAGAVAPAG